MVKPLELALILATTAAFPPNWGVQDVWVHTSTWYAGHCTCLCQPLCSHPSDNMKTNLVSSGLVPRFNNFSIPRCDEPIQPYASAAISAVGQIALQDNFPVGFSRNLVDMWSPTVPEGNVPNFGYPCGGLQDESYLRSVVQLTKKYRAPKLLTDNIGKEVNVADLRAAFKKDWGADVVLKCLDGAFADVLSCFTKGPALQASGEIFPAKITACPPQIASFDECTNATTSILAYSIPTQPPTDAPVTDTPEPTTKSPATRPPKTTKTPVTLKPTTLKPTKTPPPGPKTTTPPTKKPTPAPGTTTPTRAPLTTIAPVPSPTEDPREVEIWVKFYERNARCAIFGETGCTYCAKAKALLESKKAKYDYFGVWADNPDHIPNGMDVYNALVRLTKQDTLPNIWIGGKFIGGSDDLQALETAGKLDQLLKDAKCV
ncbi:Aste57867_1956 [Aphanomyces stellatus]|uniref:Aste57867_1956 protein n=1 Tax=Aphanomyces stellatus TaxID=120398 RepID=A0A485KAQ8_9STRA|nr:hypothetical protein As57867_001954 [Aphanomyces stellatus]VFT79161.1 Aste57867_1956 [Aphanomyces stellatus]